VRPVFKPPYPGLWWSALWCFAYFLVINAVAAGLGIAWVMARMVLAKDLHMSRPSVRDIAQITLPIQAVADVVVLAFALVVTRLLVGPEWQRRLALRRPAVTQLLLAIFGLPALMYISSGVHVLAKQVLPTFGYQKGIIASLDPWPTWLGVLAIGLGPALSEELWYRGFLGRGLVGRYGPIGGVMITSLFFGIMHVDPPHIVATAVMGILLHFSYLMTRSLWVPMLLHFLNNSAAVLLAKVPALGVFDDPKDQVAVPIYLVALALWAAVGWALYRSRPYLPAVPEGNRESWRPEFPSVEHPPSGCGAVLVRPRPDWLAVTLVVIAFTGFVLMISYYMNAS
jgi:membrane protease YdiL (CAAX protease family)